MRATCTNCGRTFEADRDDAIFCTDLCKASYHRTHSSPGKHKDLPRYKSKTCEWCGNLFWYNEYADRAGQRPPTYDSQKCRQAAWRERHKTPTGYNERVSQSRSRESFREQQRQSQAPPKQEEPPQEDFRDLLTIPRRWNETDALMWIFGVVKPTAIDVVNKRCRELNRKYHPDKNGGKIYKHLSTINAAWDYLKRINK